MYIRYAIHMFLPDVLECFNFAGRVAVGPRRDIMRTGSGLYANAARSTEDGTARRAAHNLHPRTPS